MSGLPDAVDQRPHYLYRVYDENCALLYVGVTRDVEHRMYLHLAPASQSATSHEIRRRLGHYTSEAYPTKLAARQAERDAIANEQPELNRQHNPARFTKAGGLTFRPTG